MPSKEMIKFVLSRVALPSLVAAGVTFGSFVGGFKSGASRQLDQDGPIIETCVSELLDAKISNTIQGTQTCDEFCAAVASLTMGTATSKFGGQRGQEPGCVCFFNIGNGTGP